VQKARSADEDIRCICGPLSGLDLPSTVGEPSRNNLLVEADEFGQAAVPRDFLDVGPDLGCRRIFAGPVIVGLEGKFVLPRQHIDKKAGKGIVPPSATDLAGLLINRKINPGPLQGLGHEQPRHPRARDDNPKFAISLRHHTSQHRPDLRQPKFKPGALSLTMQSPIADRLSSLTKA
jgi:hypothetical protein